MRSERNRALLTAMFPLALAVVLIVTGDASWWWAVGATAVGLLIVAVMFRTGRHTPWADARDRIAPGHAVVFWKPGCAYCRRLLSALGDDKRVTWVNVWRDEEANAEVRRHNNGDEYTPTALVGVQVLRNPSADELRAALQA